MIQEETTNTHSEAATISGWPAKSITTNYFPIKYFRGSDTKIYLAKSSADNELYVMKVYENQNGAVSGRFLKELSFSELDHPNVISFLEHSTYYQHKVSGTTKDCSYFIMPLAGHGDFFDVIETRTLENDEKLVRTYFQQLQSAVYYLHDNGVAHLDLKPSNMLLTSNYELKICDFDVAFKKGDQFLISKGSKTFRSPELAQGKCKDPFASDVYSMALSLFTMMFGKSAHLEGGIYEGYDLSDLLTRDSLDMFWEAHYNLGTFDYVDPDFKSLFEKMVKPNPLDRISAEEIMFEDWFLKETYSEEELVEVMTEKAKKFKEYN